MTALIVLMLVLTVALTWRLRTDTRCVLRAVDVIRPRRTPPYKPLHRADR